MNDKIVKVGSILDNISTRKDGSIKMVFETQEVTSEQGVNLFSMRNKFGWLLFIPEEVEEIEVPKPPTKEFKEDKSPSQRLRSVLYVWWQQLGLNISFDDFYKQKVERFIEQIKERLE